MDLGTIAKRALQRSELPVNQDSFLDLARGYVNDNIAKLWYSCRADWQTSSSQFTTVVGSDTYILNKYFDGFVKDGMRGVTTYRRIIKFVEPERFFRITQALPYSSGNPVIVTHGDYYGIDYQIDVPSQITFKSSFATKTVGSVKVIAKSNRIMGSGTLFNRNDINSRFKIAGDAKSYKVLNVNPFNQEITLDQLYDGGSNDTASYELGDIDISVNVKGYVAGAVDSEDVLLNGATNVTTQKVFTTVLSVSKDQMTAGKVTATTSTGFVIAQLDPTELEIERRSCKLWRIPSTVETIQYRFFMRHPNLKLDSDRPLIPEKYHRLIVDMVEADLRGWSDRQIPPKLSSDINAGMEKYINDANDTWQGSTVQQPEGVSVGYNDFFNFYTDQDFAMTNEVY
jgi:hypothetical protein